MAVVFVPLLDPDSFVPDADVIEADADSESEADADAEAESDAAAVVAAASSVEAAAVWAAVLDAFCSCLRRISALESVSDEPGHGHADVKATKMKRVESKEKRPEPFILMESARAVESGVSVRSRLREELLAQAGKEATNDRNG